MITHVVSPYFFFFNDTATTEIYTLSLHDALPIFGQKQPADRGKVALALQHVGKFREVGLQPDLTDRKSTRLNSSHQIISYAVFCLKKKKQHPYIHHRCARFHPSFPHLTDTPLLST